MIVMDQVGKGFGSKVVLQQVSVVFEPGTRWCIIGRSGVGKSMLMKILIGLIAMDEGEVLWNGKSIRTFREKDWRAVREQFGVVFQGAALFDSLSIRENVGLKADESRQQGIDAITQRVQETLELVGLNPEIMPQLTHSLSGGMQKRVAIARAIMEDPAFLFYDEPTTGLDPVSSQGIDELMLSLGQAPNRTSLIITHDMQTVRKVATHVLMLGHGETIFQGTIEAFLTSSHPDIKTFLRLRN